ncbi:MAG: methionyl-tRNA formyltransferase [Chloracidobacterium sp.]|nr:methionyl-tRNA formyltransferase [Chloracidobacterium sp.]
MRIVFMGTPKAAVPSLERLLSDGHEICAVYTQPDRPSGRGNKITFSPIKECALHQNIPVFQPTKIRTSEALEEYRSHSADVAVVVAYGRILPDTFLTAFPKGAINVHFSLLPKYRGAAPVNWAIVNGEVETGVTTMQMDVGLDTGDILLQRATKIKVSENAIDLMERLSAIGAELLSATLMDLGNLKPVKQDESAATFAPIMKREDGLIDWQMSAGNIANRVRGFQPFPASFTFIDRAKLTLWQANLAETTSDAPSGTVLTANGDIFEVACGDRSVLTVGEVQPEGKRRMSVRDFLNGAKPQIGTILGE